MRGTVGIGLLLLAALSIGGRLDADPPPDQPLPKVAPAFNLQPVESNAEARARLADSIATIVIEYPPSQYVTRRSCRICAAWCSSNRMPSAMPPT